MKTTDFPNASETFRRLNPHLFEAGRLSPRPVEQRDPLNEPVAEDARKADDQGFRFVRVTSFRRKLCDERNLHEKAFVDFLTECGALVDDSQAWAKIDVSQIKVDAMEDERTEIEISDQPLDACRVLEVQKQ